MSLEIILNLKHHIDNLIKIFKIIKKQIVEESITTFIQRRLQENYETWVNRLNNLIELESVLRFGENVLTANDRHETKYRLEFEANKKKVAELKQKIQKIKSKNKKLKNSGRKHHRKKRKEAQEFIKTIQINIRILEEKNKNINTFLYQQQEKVTRFQQQLEVKIDTFRRGLSPERIQKFAKFTADESHVGDQCAICMEGFEIGRNIMCLDCDGKHAFCKICIEGWFADHKTCPLCRHIF